MTMKKAALFDLDGVVLDTEKQYSHIWGIIGQQFHPEIPHFEMIIKGQTLKQIFAAHFPDVEQQYQVTQVLNQYEAQMKYEFVLGADVFISQLRAAGIRTALVTSSNDVKMNNVYNAIPTFCSMWDEIVTADKLKRSKPDPECYLLAAQMLCVAPSECVVFEDSLHGLQAGRAAQMKVVGLATTYPHNVIADKANVVIDNFYNQSVTELLND